MEKSENVKANLIEVSELPENKLQFKCNLDEIKNKTGKEIDCTETAVKEDGEMLICLDQAVGALEVCVNNGAGFVKWLENNIQSKGDKVRETIESDKYNKNIVIVLESPNIDEFKNGASCGPAIGPTGEKISKYLCGNIFKYLVMRDYLQLGAYSNINSEIENGPYCVWFVNAIPIQCSLGIGDEVLKNRNLTELWDNHQNVRDNFCMRLSKCSPDVIINCCTKIIQDKVQSVIVKNFNCLTLKGFHPSSAYFCHGFDK